MTTKARGEITLVSVVDVSSVTRYYRLQSSTSATPSKPTANPPSGWLSNEPAYTSGSTNSLYFVDLTEFSDGSYIYSNVSLSTSYEAAKAAYNKAVDTQNNLDNLEIGGRNLLLGTGTAMTAEIPSLNSNNYRTIDFYSLYQPYNAIVKEGDLITVSFDWAATVTEDCYFSVEMGTSTPFTWGNRVSCKGTRSTTSHLVDVTPSNLSGHVEITFRATATQASAADTLRQLRIRVDGTPWVGKAFTISNAKAERGSKATDWTPAPEDVETRLENAESAIDQQADQISLRVSKGSIISEINQTAETVTIKAKRIDLTDVFAQDITATNLHITGDSTFDGELNGATGYFNGSIVSVGNNGYVAIDGGRITSGTYDISAVNNKVVFAVSDTLNLWGKLHTDNEARFGGSVYTGGKLAWNDGTPGGILTNMGRLLLCSFDTNPGIQFFRNLATSATSTIYETANGLLTVRDNFAVSGTLTVGGFAVPRMQKGSVSISSVTSTHKEFSVTFPKAFSAAPNVQLTALHNSNSALQVKLKSVSATGFTADVWSGATTGITAGVYWLATY